MKDRIHIYISHEVNEKLREYVMLRRIKEKEYNISKFIEQAILEKLKKEDRK